MILDLCAQDCLGFRPVPSSLLGFRVIESEPRWLSGLRVEGLRGSGPVVLARRLHATGPKYRHVWTMECLRYSMQVCLQNCVTFGDLHKASHPSASMMKHV